jgi:hypothetical protein
MGYEVKRWRDVLPVHPAADLFPLMSESELRELGEDIKKNGLRSPITVYNGELLDGRNRLDAMVLAGIEIEIRLPHKGTLSFHRLDIDGIYAQQGVSELPPCTDPYAYVLSANIHRRHLTADQKRELIEKLLKVKPNASDRTIANPKSITRRSPRSVPS